jgi:hypothetical protein
MSDQFGLFEPKETKPEIAAVPADPEPEGAPDSAAIDPLVSNVLSFGATDIVRVFRHVAGLFFVAPVQGKTKRFFHIVELEDGRFIGQFEDNGERRSDLGAVSGEWVDRYVRMGLWVEVWHR